MVAFGVWYFSGSSERTHQAEIAESLEGVKYRVKCNECGATFEMEAQAYLSELGAEGVRCVKCGQSKAWQIGSTDSPDPSEFRSEMEAIVSVGEAQQAAHAVQEELNRVQRAIDAAETSNGSESLEKLNAEKSKLQAKSIAVYARWEEIKQEK